jgi:hypothetical protein
MSGGVLEGLAFEEAALLGEGVEHLGGRVVGGRVADLVAGRHCHRHYLLFLLTAVIEQSITNPTTTIADNST